MKSEIKFGIKELTVGILGSFIYCLLSLLQYHLYATGSQIFGMYVFIPGIAVAVLAAIFGPVVGAICSVAGQLVANVYVYGDAVLIDLLVILIVGFAMGLLADKLRVLEGGYNWRSYIDSNVVHIVISIGTLVMMRPLYAFLVHGGNLEASIVAGMQVCAGNAVVMLTLGSLGLWGVSLIAGIITRSAGSER